MTDVLIATSQTVALGWVYQVKQWRWDGSMDRYFDFHKSNGGTGMGL